MGMTRPSSSRLGPEAEGRTGAARPPGARRAIQRQTRVGVRPNRASVPNVRPWVGSEDHVADRWIAATALHMGLPLVAHDGIFRDVPGLALLTSVTA